MVLRCLPPVRVRLQFYEGKGRYFPNFSVGNQPPANENHQATAKRPFARKAVLKRRRPGRRYALARWQNQSLARKHASTATLLGLQEALTGTASNLKSRRVRQYRAAIKARYALGNGRFTEIFA